MNRLFQLGSILLVSLVFASFMPSSDSTSVAEAGGDAVNWMTWEEAIAANKKDKKKIFVDVYTDWCGWCKRMDKTTFSDPAVAKEMNDNFHNVKLDAEQKENIVYGGHTYKFVSNYGRKGVHELAFTLLDGRMSYPQYVFMDEAEGKLITEKGYKQTDDFLKTLKFISSNAYKKTSLASFKSGKAK